MDEGELEKLLEKQKIEPEKYCSRSRPVGIGHVDTLDVVYECPCNGLRLFENFIREESGTIAEYLRRRASKLLGHAEAVASDATSIAESNAALH
jgi:hypothetical protein